MAPSTTQKFPSVSHPLSRLASRECLSISGKSRDGAESVDWSLGSPSPQPPESIRSQSVAGSIPGRADSRLLPARCGTSQDSKRVSTDEVLLVLEEKLRSSNLPLVRRMFRSNDPNGEGKVTKEAFSRILWHLCGYLSPRQISHVLRRLGLDKSSLITFEDLFCYFRRPQSRDKGREQVGFTKSSMSIRPPNSASDAISYAKGQSTAYASPEEVAEISWQALKTKASTGEIDFYDFFPPMCFGNGAYVIPGQLRECLQKLHIPSSDDIVAKIFRKFEGGSPYAVHTKRLFQSLGVDAEGRLLKTPPSGSSTPKFKTPRPIMSPKKSSTTPRDSAIQRPATSQCNEIASQKAETPQLTPVNLPSARPKTSTDTSSTRIFDGDIGDMIGKKLNEGQANVIRALEAKDSNGSGTISKPHLREAFAALGFPIKPTDMEHFLSRNGLRRKDGMVNYRLLLRRLQTRSGRGLLNKVMRSHEHVFHDTTPPSTPSDGASAMILERKLLDIFQREFLALLAAFRQFDLNGTGFLTPDEFRTALERRYLVKFTDATWEQCIESSYVRLVQPPNNATQGQIGYVPYNDFLAKFDVMLRPSTVDAEDPWVEKEVDLKRLREHKERYLNSMDIDPADHTHRHEPRPLDQLEVVLVDVLLYKFHNFKKEYDMIVREDFCRIDKEKFDYIMFRCGFVLTASELSRLWLSMPITRPMESLSFPTILQHVMRLYYSALKPAKFSKTSRDSVIVSHVLEKIRVPMVSNWNLLKKKLRFLDPMGTSRIPKEDMLAIIRGLRPNINDMELHYLIEMLESRVSGKTNYFRMMEYFTKNTKGTRLDTADKNHPPLSTDSSRVYQKFYDINQLPKQHNYRHPTPVKPDFITLRNAPATPPFKRINMQPGVARRKKYPALEKQGINGAMNKSFPYRGNFDTLAHHPPSTVQSRTSKDSLAANHVKPRIGARDMPFLGRALRKEDKQDCGRISVEAFKKILLSYGITFRDPNEMYKLLRRYDRKMTDEISYEKFLQAIA
ncbi:unnamed protein product [Clavelina lepadiformis]|uniref:EF-hand domain-containing protein n=1 Tax=Clavelina lepadiformis TaxID=159417 RepID=A0ABP0FWQ0_CLALP